MEINLVLSGAGGLVVGLRHVAGGAGHVGGGLGTGVCRRGWRAVASHVAPKKCQETVGPAGLTEPSIGRAIHLQPDPKNLNVGPKIPKSDPTQPMSHTSQAEPKPLSGP